MYDPLLDLLGLPQTALSYILIFRSVEDAYLNLWGLKRISFVFFGHFRLFTKSENIVSI